MLVIVKETILPTKILYLMLNFCEITSITSMRYFYLYYIIPADVTSKPFLEESELFDVFAVSNILLYVFP